MRGPFARVFMELCQGYVLLGFFMGAYTRLCMMSYLGFGARVSQN